MLKNGKKRLDLDKKIEKRARYGLKLHGNRFDYSHIKARKQSSPEELQDNMMKYFNNCDDNELPYTKSGLMLSLCLSNNNLNDIYKRGEGFASVIEWAWLVIENNTHTLALTDKINSNIAGLTLKNCFSWTDKKEVTTREGGDDSYELWLKNYNKKLEHYSSEAIDVTETGMIENCEIVKND